MKTLLSIKSYATSIQRVNMNKGNKNNLVNQLKRLQAEKSKIESNIKILRKEKQNGSSFTRRTLDPRN